VVPGLGDREITPGATSCPGTGPATLASRHPRRGARHAGREDAA